MRSRWFKAFECVVHVGFAQRRRLPRYAVAPSSKHKSKASMKSHQQNSPHAVEYSMGSIAQDVMCKYRIQRMQPSALGHHCCIGPLHRCTVITGRSSSPVLFFYHAFVPEIRPSPLEHGTTLSKRQLENRYVLKVLTAFSQHPAGQRGLILEIWYPVHILI